MKTYSTISAFETALKKGEVTIREWIGVQGQFVYAECVVVGTDDRICKVKLQ